MVDPVVGIQALVLGCNNKAAGFQVLIPSVKSYFCAAALECGRLSGQRILKHLVVWSSSSIHSPLRQSQTTEYHLPGSIPTKVGYSDTILHLTHTCRYFQLMLNGRYCCLLPHRFALVKSFTHTPDQQEITHCCHSHEHLLA